MCSFELLVKDVCEYEHWDGICLILSSVEGGDGVWVGAFGNRGSD